MRQAAFGRPGSPSRSITDRGRNRDRRVRDPSSQLRRSSALSGRQRCAVRDRGQPARSRSRTLVFRFEARATLGMGFLGFADRPTGTTISASWCKHRCAWRLDPRRQAPCVRSPSGPLLVASTVVFATGPSFHIFVGPTSLEIMNQSALPNGRRRCPRTISPTPPHRGLQHWRSRPRCPCRSHRGAQCGGMDSAPYRHGPSRASNS